MISTFRLANSVVAMHLLFHNRTDSLSKVESSLITCSSMFLTLSIKI